MFKPWRFALRLIPAHPLQARLVLYFEFLSFEFVSAHFIKSGEIRISGFKLAKLLPLP
jgi:hypothetical protein